VPPTNPWIYNKTENLTLSELSLSHFTHIISEHPPTDPEIAGRWKLMKTIRAFDHVVFEKQLLTDHLRELPGRIFDLIRVVEEDKLWIYERK
jgi:alpha-1,6-mannosyltransferase